MIATTKIGLIHYPFQNTSFERFLTFASETGYRYVELGIGDIWHEKDPVDEPEKRAEEIRKEVENHKLKVSALSSGNDFILLRDKEISQQIERMKRIIKLARVLGTKCIRTEGGMPKDSVPSTKWSESIANCLKRLLPILEMTGVALAVDNHGMVTNEKGVLEKIFDKIRHPLIGTNLDIYNYRWFGHDIATTRELWKKMLPYVLHTHMKDGIGSRETYRGKALGEGEIGVIQAVTMLKESGYDGVWCAEYEGDEGDKLGYAKCFHWMSQNI